MARYMSATDDKSPVYQLYAVVVHLDVMNSSFSGHYVCYVKDTQGKWYKTDDTKVCFFLVLSEHFFVHFGIKYIVTVC